jgi:hypothetical protein
VVGSSGSKTAVVVVVVVVGGVVVVEGVVIFGRDDSAFEVPKAAAIAKGDEVGAFAKAPKADVDLDEGAWVGDAKEEDPKEEPERPENEDVAYRENIRSIGCCCYERVVYFTFCVVVGVVWCAEAHPFVPNPEELPKVYLGLLSF